MRSLGTWYNFFEFSEYNLPNQCKIQACFQSKNWCIAGTKENITIFKISQNPISLPFSETICKISCNHDMAFILTNSGNIWIWGEDSNKTGLFGQECLFHSNVPIRLQVFNSFITDASLSSTHAGAVCSKGVLYTWGTGLEGELCSDFSFFPTPTKIENSAIFNISQVACGNGYTAICTKGGFLYIYGNRFKNHCVEYHKDPYTISELTEFYIEKVMSSPFGIISITDNGKCYLTEENNVVKLPASKTIETIAACTAGIAGLSSDKTKIYIWTKKDSWKVSLYKLNFGYFDKIESGLNNGLCVTGKFHDFPNSLVLITESPKESLLSSTEKERKKFKELFMKFDKPANNNFVNLQKEGIKQIVKAANSHIFKIFVLVKNYCFLKSMLKKAYATIFTPNSIEKVFQRLNAIHKSYVFQLIYKFSQNSLNNNQRLKNHRKAILGLKRVFDGLVKKFYFKKIFKPKYFLLFSRLGEKFRKKIIFRIIRVGNKETYKEKVCGPKLKAIVLKPIKNCFEILTSSVKILKRTKFFEKIEKFLFGQNCKNMKKLINHWSFITEKVKKQEIAKKIKFNAITLLVFQISKLLKNSFSEFLTLIKPKKPGHEQKYGAFMLFSTMQKVVNRKKINFFNVFFRVYNESYTEIMGGYLKMIFNRRVSSSFHSIKLHATKQWNTKIVKFALFFQSHAEKLKYRYVLRGINAFKINFWNRSMVTEPYDKSFLLKSFQFLKTPPSEIVDEDSSDTLFHDIPISQSFTNNEFARRSSTVIGNQNFTQKFPRLTAESKSEVLVLKKTLSKLKNLKTSNQKRIAYDELLKEKNKNKPTKILKKKQPLIQKTKTPEKLEKASLNGQSKLVRYQVSFANLTISLSKILKKLIRFSFYSLKSQPKNPFIASPLNKDFFGKKTESNSFASKVSKLDLKIDTKVNTKNKEKVNSARVYKMPENSPIFMNELTPNLSSWKLKMLSLGLSKFSNIINQVIKTKGFIKLLANK